MCFSVDGGCLVLGGYDGVVMVYDCDMGYLVFKIKVIEEVIVCVDVFDSGDVIVIVINEEIFCLVMEGNDVSKEVYKVEFGVNE